MSHTHRPAVLKVPIPRAASVPGSDTDGAPAATLLQRTDEALCELLVTMHREMREKYVVAFCDL